MADHDLEDTDQQPATEADVAAESLPESSHVEALVEVDGAATTTHDGEQNDEAISTTVNPPPVEQHWFGALLSKPERTANEINATECRCCRGAFSLWTRKVRVRVWHARPQPMNPPTHTRIYRSNAYS